MPLVGIITGGVDFSDKVIVLREATETAEMVTVNYGLFINNIIDFLIVAFAIFIAIRQVNKLSKKEEKKKKKILSQVRKLSFLQKLEIV
jgi:large conductance mechanosensitive channel